MAKLEDIIAYFVSHYPYSEELSNARLTKSVYLADWYGLVNDIGRVSQINWYFDSYGPFVFDIKDCAEKSELFSIENTTNLYGDRKSLIRLRDPSYRPSVSIEEKQALDYVIEKTKPLNWSEFIRLVYSTYPIATSSKFSSIDLSQKAKEYVKKRK